MGFDLLIYFCACVRLHKSGPSLSDGGEYSEERERKRKPRRHRRSLRVIYIRFFIMKYFKNKLNTSKETSPANLDGLGVQGRQSQNSDDLILVLLFDDLYVLCRQERD